MATLFPVDRFPLMQGIEYEDHPRYLRDKLSDGTPRVRQISSQQWRTVPLHFAPMCFAESKELTDYLDANAGTEFVVEQQGGWFQGYLWDSVDTEYEGAAVWVTATLYGKKVPAPQGV